jgi:hypothetical protein
VTSIFIVHVDPNGIKICATINDVFATAKDKAIIPILTAQIVMATANSDIVDKVVSINISVYVVVRSNELSFDNVKNIYFCLFIG